MDSVGKAAKTAFIGFMVLSFGYLVLDWLSSDVPILDYWFWDGNWGIFSINLSASVGGAMFAAGAQEAWEQDGGWSPRALLLAAGLIGLAIFTAQLLIRSTAS